MTIAEMKTIALADDPVYGSDRDDLLRIVQELHKDKSDAGDEMVSQLLQVVREFPVTTTID